MPTCTTYDRELKSAVGAFASSRRLLEELGQGLSRDGHVWDHLAPIGCVCIWGAVRESSSAING